MVDVPAVLAIVQSPGKAVHPSGQRPATKKMIPPVMIEPSEPAAPAAPSRPAAPSAPAGPRAPGAPGSPFKPCTPGAPGDPSRPSRPAGPGTGARASRAMMRACNCCTVRRIGSSRGAASAGAEAQKMTRQSRTTNLFMWDHPSVGKRRGRRGTVQDKGEARADPDGRSAGRVREISTVQAPSR